MGTLGEGEPNTVGRAELMACVVAAESTRGNVVYVTDNEILEKRQDRGWPMPRLGQGSNPDLWWRMSRALKIKARNIHGAVAASARCGCGHQAREP